MSTISLQDLERDPAALLDRVEAGEILIVSRDGRPVALIQQISPYPLGPRPFGLAAGEFRVPPDFDSPLPGVVLDAFEGR